MDAVASVLLALVLAYVGYAAYAIVVVHRRTRWLDPERIAAATVDELYEEFPALRAGVVRVAPLGFVPCAAARIDQDPTQPRVIALRRPDDDAAMGVSLFRTHKDPVVVTELTQRDASGRPVSVQDAPLPSLFSFACLRVWRFPGASPAELWTAFARIRAADAGHLHWQRLPPGDEVETLRACARQQVGELVQRGMLRLDPHGPPRLTWRGAASSTLKMLWPWRNLADRAQIAAARRAAGLS